MEAEGVGGDAGPVVGAEGAAALEGVADGVEFGRGLGLVHKRQPIVRAVDGPGGEEAGDRCAGQAATERAPRPEFRAVDEVRAEGVALDVPEDDQQVRVGLDGEGFEPALVEVAGARRLVVGVVALGVEVGDAAEELRQLAVGGRVEGHVPVVGHEAVVEEAGGVAFERLEKDALEGGVVGVLVEEGAAADAAVEGVVDQAAGGVAGTAGHAGSNVMKEGKAVKTNRVPFFGKRGRDSFPDGYSIIEGSRS